MNVPLAILFGGWANYVSLSKQRREYLALLLEASLDIRHEMHQRTAFNQWLNTTRNNTTLRWNLLAWYRHHQQNQQQHQQQYQQHHQQHHQQQHHQQQQPPPTTTTTTPFHFKSTCFSIWQSYTAASLLLRQCTASQTRALQLQTFVTWSTWTWSHALRRQHHAKALHVALRKRQHRALSQWRLSTRLSLVQRRKAGNRKGPPSMPQSVTALRINTQKIGASRLIPLLQRLHLKMSWHRFIHQLNFIANLIEPRFLQQVQQTRVNKTRVLQTIVPFGYVPYKHGRLFQQRRMFCNWKNILVVHHRLCASFRMNTIGRRAYRRWLFVHDQRRQSKIIQSPKVTYGGKRKKRIVLLQQVQQQRLCRRLHLPNRRGTNTKKPAVLLLKQNKENIEHIEHTEHIEHEVGGNAPGVARTTTMQEAAETLAFLMPQPPTTSTMNGAQNIVSPRKAPTSLSSPLPPSPLSLPLQDASIFMPLQLHPLWNTTFYRLSSNTKNPFLDNGNMNSDPAHMSGDVVLELLCRMGAFTRGMMKHAGCISITTELTSLLFPPFPLSPFSVLGWLRSIGGAYTLMRNVVGHDYDSGYESILLNRDQFRVFLSKMLCQYCERLFNLRKNNNGSSNRRRPRHNDKHEIEKNIQILNNQLKKDQHQHERLVVPSFPQPASVPKMFRVLSSIVRDKLERPLWSIFKKYGFRSKDIMMVNYTQMLKLAQDCHLIGVSSISLSTSSSSSTSLRYGRRMSARNYSQLHTTSSASTSAIHTGLTRRDFCKCMHTIVGYMNGGMHDNIAPSSATATIKPIDVQDMHCTFPGFVVLIAYIVLVSPDFTTGHFNERLEQLLNVMRI